MSPFEVTEAGIGELRAALGDGRTSSTALVEAYLRRIEAYDRGGPRLNSVVVLNPDALAEGAAADRRRARGESLGPLDGIPYTAKDSYLVKGLTAAAGSHAFADLVAQRDAFAVEQLRRGGAVLIGLTNMPPMANGGMQRGLYGRAESPYSADYLTSAYGSGSSNGSGSCLQAPGLRSAAVLTARRRRVFRVTSSRSGWHVPRSTSLPAISISWCCLCALPVRMISNRSRSIVPCVC